MSAIFNFKYGVVSQLKNLSTTQFAIKTVSATLLQKRNTAR
jgi:hypothetical protein